MVYCTRVLTADVRSLAAYCRLSMQESNAVTMLQFYTAGLTAADITNAMALDLGARKVSAVACVTYA
jgi:hypothetical protein